LEQKVLSLKRGGLPEWRVRFSLYGLFDGINLIQSRNSVPHPLKQTIASDGKMNLPILTKHQNQFLVDATEYETD
jgi:hypothetical protein